MQNTEQLEHRLKQVESQNAKLLEAGKEMATAMSWSIQHLPTGGAIRVMVDKALAKWKVAERKAL